MVRGNQRLTIPSNPEYSIGQLRMLIREVDEILDREISLEEWTTL